MKLLKFYAPWCAPCKELTRQMEEMELNVEVIPIDIDEDEDAVLEYGIRGVPTTILLNENEEVIERATGLVPIKKLLTTHLG